MMTIVQRAFNDFPSSLNLSSLKVNHEFGWLGAGAVAGSSSSSRSQRSNSVSSIIGGGAISSGSQSASNKHSMMSRADQGGVLEAVNLILNRCDKDFIDRDLRRTGTSILLLTAGNGVLRVPPNITRLTQQVTLRIPPLLPLLLPLILAP
jgi:hypothetical protein